MSTILHEMYNKDEDLLQYWEHMFEAWRTNPEGYKIFLDKLREEFKTAFKEYAPLQMIGDCRRIYISICKRKQWRKKMKYTSISIQ